MVQDNVIDPEVELPEALLRCLFVAELILEIGEEDSSLSSAVRILKPLEERPEGAVGSVAGLLALLEETVHGAESHHWSTYRANREGERGAGAG